MRRPRPALALLCAALLSACDSATVVTFQPDPIVLSPGGTLGFTMVGVPALPGTTADYRLEVRATPESGASLDIRLVALGFGPLGGPLLMLTTASDTPKGTYDLQVDLQSDTAWYTGLLQVAIVVDDVPEFDGGSGPGPFPVDAGTPPPPPPEPEADAGSAGEPPGSFDAG